MTSHRPSPPIVTNTRHWGNMERLTRNTEHQETPLNWATLTTTLEHRALWTENTDGITLEHGVKSARCFESERRPCTFQL